MKVHVTESAEPSAQDLASALAQLAHGANCADSSASPGQSAVMAGALEVLLDHCCAGRGALVLLPINPLHDGTQPIILALRDISAEDVRASLASVLSLDHTGSEQRATTGQVTWMLYELPTFQPDIASDEPTRLVLVFEWTGAAKEGATPVTHAAQTWLPLMADAAGAVVGQALLADRVRALSAAVANHEALAHELREARADWERTFNAISDPVSVVTANYQIVHANTAYLQIFGRNNDGQVGHECFEAGPGRASPCVGCPLPRTLETQRPAFAQQARMLPTTPGGEAEQRVYQTWTYPIPNAGGKVERVVEILKDITEQERMRQTLTQVEALREADKLKAELLGTVSHELRSPLATIKGYAATLLRHERRLPREERREFLLAIEEASDRLSVIIDRLLEMSQLETGTLRLNRMPIDIADVARAALAACAERVNMSARRHVTFTLRFYDVDGKPIKTAPLVDGDPRRLRDVLDNLLENAIKYSPDGGAVDISLRVVPSQSFDPVRRARDATEEAATAANMMLELTVSDTGIGIPLDHLGRIFDHFHRVDTRLTREVDGLGLGLAICKRIVELHGGMIWANSQPGQCSAFHVLLPLAANTSDIGAITASSESEYAVDKSAPTTTSHKGVEVYASQEDDHSDCG